MPRHPFAPPRGRYETFQLRSEALAGNLLGDPSTRTVGVYLPEAYDAGDPSARYPLFVDLAGYTGSGLYHANWRFLEESVPQQLDRLLAQQALGPVVIAFPDGFTSLGGNQYVDSPVTGGWETFLTRELPAALEARYRLRPGRDHRAVFGKSSGGYGALMHGIRHPEAWAAVASHSGDMGFEYCVRPDLPKVLTALAKAGGIARFLAAVADARKPSAVDTHTLMFLAMAATYDPDPDPAAPAGVRLPVDMHTCKLDPLRWRAWLEHDPLHLVERTEVQTALRSLKGLYLDCGSSDQYHLHYGSRQLAATLAAAGVPHRYEEFDDDHSNVDYRMDVSLPFLYRALCG